MRKTVLANLIPSLLVATTFIQAWAQGEPPVRNAASNQAAATQGTSGNAASSNTASSNTASGNPASGHKAAGSTASGKAASTEPGQSQTNAKSASAPGATPSSDQSTVWPATTRAEAALKARANCGRVDPLSQIQGFKPFPSGAAASESKIYAEKPFNKSLIPPPPAGLKLQVPPPPNTSAQEELPVSELPVPPERPSIVNKLKLVGIVDNKAIFAITDLSVRRINKWPRSLLLGAGDHFESIEVVSISADSALLEENGEQTTKRLERIR